MYLRDNVGAHMMQSNGSYRRVRNKLEPVSAQSTLYEMAQLAVTADKLPMESVCSLYSAADNSAQLYYQDYELKKDLYFNCLLKSLY